MRKKMALLAAAGLVATVLAVPGLGATNVSAHNLGPCNDSGEPGNSDYAQHHIVALATTGGLGGDGHIPGTHMGFSACLDVHD